MKVEIEIHKYQEDKPTISSRLYYVSRHGFDRWFMMAYYNGWFMDGREYDDVELWIDLPNPYEVVENV